MARCLNKKQTPRNVQPRTLVLLLTHLKFHAYFVLKLLRYRLPNQPVRAYRGFLANGVR
jgi:hypothetical protein